MKKPLKYWLSCVVCCVLAMGLLSASLNSNQAQSISIQPLPSLLPVALLPVSNDRLKNATQSSQIASTSAEVSPILTAQSAVVLDMESGAILLAKNSELPLFPASTTKLMTALVARDLYDLNVVVTIGSEHETPGTVVGLKPGDKLTVAELLQASLIQSANDAATVLANHHPEGAGAFVAAMNQKAAALHLSQTHFSNPSGIDAADQLTTSRDLALIARQVLSDPVLAQMVSTKATNIGAHQQYALHNTHALLGKNGVMGVKTGTTELAGEVLVTLVGEADHQILIVLMNSQKRYDETQALINWVSNHFSWYTTQSVMSYASR